MRGEELIRALERPCASSLYGETVAAMQGSFDALRQEGILAVVPDCGLPRQESIARTPLGAMRRSLASVLGLWDGLLECVVSGITPRCPRCQELARAPTKISELSLPDDGTIIFALLGDEQDFTLRERCELLGVERALVQGRIKGASSLEAEDGEPIIAAVSARESEQLNENVRRWFARGGGPLRVVHFASRDAIGRHVGELYGSWWCTKCTQQIEAVTRALLQGCAPCSVCRGEGWIQSKVEGALRDVACRECDGFGSTESISRDEFDGVPLRYVATLSFSDFVRKSVPGSQLHQSLLEVQRCGLGGVPIGTPVDLCSPGERVQMAILVGQLHGIAQAQFLLDEGYAPFEASLVGMKNHGIGLTFARPCEDHAVSLPSQEGIDGEALKVCAEVLLREIRVGPLRIPELSLPIGALSVVQGPIGVGKSLLLTVIQQRFAHRRTLSHLATFGELRRCSRVQGITPAAGTMMDLLGLSDIVAYEIARTRRAKEFGLIEKDLRRDCARYWCQECSGRGVVTDGVVCDACEGGLYNPRIGTLSLLGDTVLGIMKRPLSSLSELLWSSHRVEQVVRIASDFVGPEVCLATAVQTLSPCVRRVVGMLAHLASIEAEGLESVPKKSRRGLTKELILIDGPNVWGKEHLSVVASKIGSLVEQGATVIYAGAPNQIELACHSVIQLEFVEDSIRALSREKYLDTRYARASRAVISNRLAG